MFFPSKIKVQEEDEEEEWLLPPTFFSSFAFSEDLSRTWIVSKSVCAVDCTAALFYLRSCSFLLHECLKADAECCLREGNGSDCGDFHGPVTSHAFPHRKECHYKNTTTAFLVCDKYKNAMEQVEMSPWRWRKEVHISHWNVTFYLIVSDVELNEKIWLEDNILNT